MSRYSVYCSRCGGYMYDVMKDENAKPKPWWYKHDNLEDCVEQLNKRLSILEMKPDDSRIS